jgi:tRNA (cytidine/uridine-2'-O-)-methyltransferase
MPKHRYTTDERFERHVVLVSPEIHWNTGNVGRTCLAVNAFLHLIKPLGFSLHARELKRAGLDYWHRVKLHIWDDFDQFETALAPGPDEIVLLTKKGRSPFWSMPSPRRLFLIFGSETKGLPKSILFRYTPQLGLLCMKACDISPLTISGSGNKTFIFKSTASSPLFNSVECLFETNHNCLKTSPRDGVFCFISTKII